jgi:hypothetical protein
VRMQKPTSESKVIVVKKSSRRGQVSVKVRHFDGFTDWIDVDPETAKLIKIGTELEAYGYSSEEERDAAAEQMKSVENN